MRALLVFGSDPDWLDGMACTEGSGHTKLAIMSAVHDASSFRVSW